MKSLVLLAALSGAVLASEPQVYRVHLDHVKDAYVVGGEAFKVSSCPLMRTGEKVVFTQGRVGGSCEKVILSLVDSGEPCELWRMNENTEG